MRLKTAQNIEYQKETKEINCNCLEDFLKTGYMD